jgi:hypothetical protein
MLFDVSVLWGGVVGVNGLLYRADWRFPFWMGRRKGTKSSVEVGDGLWRTDVGWVFFLCVAGICWKVVGDRVGALGVWDL